MMGVGHMPSSRTMVRSGSPFHLVILVCLVAVVSYLVARVGGALVLRPQMIWPLWPGCAFLVAVLLLFPRKIWPILIVAGVGGFVLYDVRAGLALRSTALLVLADIVEILIAALGVRYFFDGVPRLNSIKALARYSLFAVILAPLLAAFMGTVALGGSYWITWRIGFFTEALAFLTLTPAILSCAGARPAWANRSRAYYLEAAALVAGLTFVGYVVFVATGRSSPPALVYSLLPFLLWASLRYGVLGTSTSMIVVAFLSTWGAVHGRGPFAGTEPLSNVLSLQLFLFLVSTPFMVLAALIEERNQAEQELRESEGRFRLMADTAPVMIWMSGADKLCTYFNKSWLDFTGRSTDSELGNGWSEGVHPQDLRRCLDTYSGSFDRQQEFRMEYQLRRYDGEYRWILDIGVPRFNVDGSFAGYIGIGIDVTERKHAEESLARISRRLIEAQEQERTRIARELHDDISQRLALLVIEMEQFRQNSPDFPTAARSRLGELQERASEIAIDVQSLSHELHSSKLSHLGITAAMRGFCKEFSEQQKVEIDFRSHDLPGPLSPDISLCLFRVLQEALHNAAKHSGIRHFEVKLWGMSAAIHLIVRDSGAGFNSGEAREGRGLGLISMEERLKLVNGKFSIESQPKRGTTVHASVPLNAEVDSMPATG
jgi:PAS domain S-box-containing protein